MRVVEAQHGVELKSATVYVAPGGKQMMVSNRGGLSIRLRDDDRLDYQPSVDLTFASLSKVFPEQTLGIVITGMGTDGSEGARLLYERDSTIWIQDEASCVVYGMPLSLKRSGFYHSVVTLDQLPNQIMKIFRKNHFRAK